MHKVQLNSDRIIENVMCSGEITCESVTDEIKSFLYYDTVNSVKEAEEIFRERVSEWGIDVEAYFQKFGGVSSNVIESFTIDILDSVFFKVVIRDYYIDPGVPYSSYLYSVEVELL